MKVDNDNFFLAIGDSSYTRKCDIPCVGENRVYVPFLKLDMKVDLKQNLHPAELFLMQVYKSLTK